MISPAVLLYTPHTAQGTYQCEGKLPVEKCSDLGYGRSREDRRFSSDNGLTGGGFCVLESLNGLEGSGMECQPVSGDDVQRETRYRG